MKRGTFKRLSLEELKKRKAKKKKRRKEKQKSIPKLKEELWEEDKRVVRKTQDWVCYTCGKTITEPKDCHTGHGLSKGSLSLKYKFDIRNLKIQCMKCNIHEQGNQEIFIGKLEKEEAGLEFLKEAGYQDENGRWRCKQLPPMAPQEVRSFLLQSIENLKLL